MSARTESLGMYPPILIRQKDVDGRNHGHDSGHEYSVIAMVLVSRWWSVWVRMGTVDK